MVEPILETRNVNDVSMHVCFIHSKIKKKNEKDNVKKNNSKCAKFLIKN